MRQKKRETREKNGLASSRKQRTLVANSLAHMGLTWANLRPLGRSRMTDDWQPRLESR